MTNPNRALQIAAEYFHVKLVGSIKYGWNEKSVGSTVVSPDGMRAWLRVHYREREQLITETWNGIIAAEHIAGVAKPSVIQTTEWEYDGMVWHADLLTFITAPVCSRTPELREPLLLTRVWWGELRKSLDRLAYVHTDRINVGQSLITRRIHEHFGNEIPTDIASWTTVHGDMHWANITHPDCWILDWEGWGVGPVGLDAAFLYCYSLLVPSIALKVEETFCDQLATPDGHIAQLFACAELIHMSETYGDHPDLVPHLYFHVQSLLSLGEETYAE